MPNTKPAETPILDGVLDPADCVSFRLRRAARLAAKAYDDALRPLGIRNTQFTLMAILHHLKTASVGDLANHLVTDQTTCTRNLNVLTRQGLVESLPDEDGRFRVTQLTDKGRRIFQRAKPVWSQTQRHLLDQMKASQWSETMDRLEAIERACGR